MKEGNLSLCTKSSTEKKTETEQNAEMDLVIKIQQKALKKLVSIKKYKCNAAAKFPPASDV